MRDRTLPCEEIRGLLDERLDRVLGGAEEAALSDHLRGCAACRAEAAALDRVHRVLAEMDPGDPGDAFTDRVVGALDRAPAPARPAVRVRPSSRVSLLRGLAFAGATAAFAALALLLLPVDAAVARLGGIVPPLPVPALPPLPSLPAIPDSAALIAAGVPDLLPPWAAAAGALAALAGVALQVASVRRRSGAHP